MLYDKKLKFIHIPRTGGTTIEDIAQKNNIYWGRFDKWYHKNINPKYSCLYGENSKLARWHLLLKDDPNLWNSYNFFLIIRNPLDRFISTYYMPFANYDGINNRYNDNIESFNKNISILLDKIKPKFIGQYGHQHHYINKKYVNNIHILCFDNFIEQSNKLFDKYNLNFMLNNSYKSGSSKYIFSKKDLYKNNIDKIKTLYKQDYDLYINTKMQTLSLGLFL